MLFSKQSKSKCRKTIDAPTATVDSCTPQLQPCAKRYHHSTTGQRIQHSKNQSSVIYAKNFSCIVCVIMVYRSPSKVLGEAATPPTLQVARVVHFLSCRTVRRCPQCDETVIRRHLQHSIHIGASLHQLVKDFVELASCLPFSGGRSGGPLHSGLRHQRRPGLLQLRRGRRCCGLHAKSNPFWKACRKQAAEWTCQALRKTNDCTCQNIATTR